MKSSGNILNIQKGINFRLKFTSKKSFTFKSPNQGNSHRGFYPTSEFKIGTSDSEIYRETFPTKDFDPLQAKLFNDWNCENSLLSNSFPKESSWNLQLFQVVLSKRDLFNSFRFG